MEKLKDIDTFYSQKVIPLAFNESLSYMEQICNLISYIENTLVPAINNNANAIKELQEYVQELKKLLDKLEQKVDENFITLNTKIDTTKEELNTKIDTIKEELITLINNVNDTLTNAINDLDSKVVEHINASNEKFNALDTSIESINTNIETINTNIETINTNIGTINTEVGTMKEQIETIDTNVTQNTNDIENLNNKIKPFQPTREFTLIPTGYDYKFQLFMNNSYQKPTIINNIFYLTGVVNFTLKIKDEYLDQMLNKTTELKFKFLTYENLDFLNNKEFNSLSCGFVQDITHNKISNLKMSLSNKQFNSNYITFTPTTQETTFQANLNLVAYLEEV